MTEATNSPSPETNESHPNQAGAPASDKKAESNRCNAQKSTGPRTEAGRANSRLNALKHGILASNSVIATIEGREHRGEFEAMVDGLAQDFQPVGTIEQLLVEDLAGSFWRKRRLLRFETRAAFEARDRRINEMMQRFRHSDLVGPVYSFDGHKVDADDILDEARLGLDLPGDADCAKLVRYEGSITRSLRLALSELRKRQTERKKNRAATPDAYADRDVVIDQDAMKLNAGPGHGSLGVKLSMLSRALDHERELEEEAEEDAANPAAAEARDQLAQALKDKVVAGLNGGYQTKPNSRANAGVRASADARRADAKPAADGGTAASGTASVASK